MFISMNSMLIVVIRNGPYKAADWGYRAKYFARRRRDNYSSSCICIYVVVLYALILSTTGCFRKYVNVNGVRNDFRKYVRLHPFKMIFGCSPVKATASLEARDFFPSFPSWFVKNFLRNIFFTIENNFWSWRFYFDTIILKSSELIQFNSNPEAPGDGRKAKVCEQRLLQPGQKSLSRIWLQL